MVSLLDQLKSDLTEMFSNRQDSYKETIVKEEYETLPKGQYPRVVISEISNNSVLDRETSEGERTTLLGYQFMVFSRDTAEYDASNSVRFMIKIIDDYIQNKYRMSRVAVTGVQAYIVDSTVMTNTSRYTCVYDKETELIYTN